MTGWKRFEKLSQALRWWTIGGHRRVNENFDLDFDIPSGLKQLNAGRPNQPAFNDY